MSFVKSFFAWVVRRLKEPSTYVGAAAAATALGADQLGVHIGQVGQIAGIVLGTGLAAATTSRHPPLEDIVARM